MAISSEPPFRPESVLRHEQHVRILVAEDPCINSFLRTVLQRHGYGVVSGEPYDASELLRTGALQADVIITNTPQAFLSYADTIPVLYIAASPDAEMALRFHTCRVLRKPFHNDDLLNAVEGLARLVVP